MSSRLLMALGLVAFTGCTQLNHPSAPFHEGLGDHTRMSHQYHANMGVDCAQCHVKVPTSASLKDGLLPLEATCLECHDWKAAGQCTICHSDVRQAAARQPKEPKLTFSHQDHIPRVAGNCGACHGKLYEPGSTGEFTPPMSTCTACHNHKEDYDEGRCQPCHLNLREQPLKPLSLYTHQGNYVKRHRQDARSGAETCNACHIQSFCTDCHGNNGQMTPERKYPERVDTNFIHRNDFQSRHAMEARADEAMCLRCHGTSYCSSCHTLNNVTPQGSNPRSPHPAGYAMGGAGNHAGEARQDIVRCAACHDQGAASVCVKCHRVGGVGGNPHAPEWLASHTHEEIRTNGMCLYCHL